ncbi:MAG: NYN domain-containing protein [Chloroflexi bacterium]|nr:NYN domain-containing protein [Chloroflexota bacterium]
MDPLALGELICSRPPPGHTRELEEVRVYTGRPDSTKDPETYGAHMRQCESWERAGAVVLPRALRYPGDWPQRRAQQKGVDVELAIDFIAGAIDGSYDVGVIFSTDTDLRPALEFVIGRFSRYPRAEAAAWRGSESNRALRTRVDPQNWVHYLNYDDYLSVRDYTDYQA